MAQRGFFSFGSLWKSGFWLCWLSCFLAYGQPASPVVLLKPAGNLQTYTVTKGACTFVAVGNPGFLRITGEKVTPKGSWVLEGKHTLREAQIRVPIAEFVTGIEKRDEHMHAKYLESKKFPESVLTVTQFSWSGDKLPEKVDVPASLTLHGVTKPITVSITLKEQEKEILVTSDFTVLLSDFSIEIPSFAGLTVAKDVTVHVELTAIPK